ncbi:DUF3604 domain-containing protein [Pseudomaricurvus hydrocarbonicus]
MALAHNLLANADPPTRQVFFGDLHLHTAWSFDASAFHVTATPEEAYRYALGQAIAHASGTPLQIHRPLDFLAVTDHAEYLGMVKELKKPNSPLNKTLLAKRFASDPTAVYIELERSTAENTPFPELENRKLRAAIWKDVVDVANKYNDPGKFTALIGYEWTANIPISPLPFRRSLHRNVIFRGDNVPLLPFTAFDSNKPERLWQWMDALRQKGQDVLAIPHSGNLSHGSMYSVKNSYGKTLSQQYSEMRRRNEPINEVIQSKGQSMIHPAQSEEDAFANFETYRYLSGDVSEERPYLLGRINGSYIRPALKAGLKIEKETGANPFEFGFIGSSDNHNGTAGPYQEDDYFGKLGLLDATPEQRLFPTSRVLRALAKFGTGGMTAIWAEKNTRAALFDALKRREVYATSGPRMRLRVFGGFHFTADLAEQQWSQIGYDHGVPMGGTLPREEIGGGDDAPPELRLLITAEKDPEGANLDRLQVIKGWIDSDGETHEKIYNVALADNRPSQPNQVTSIGNTVDLKTAAYTNSIGDSKLTANWQDPEFDATQSAFYYVRLLEIPTPRWTTIQAVQLGKELRKDVPPTIQERAWSSPIWYRGHSPEVETETETETEYIPAPKTDNLPPQATGSPPKPTP